MKKRNNKKGFTLIELIVVIAILAILAAVAVPSYMGLIQKAEDATIQTAVVEYINAINVHNTLATTDAEKITTLGARNATGGVDEKLGTLKPVTELDDDFDLSTKIEFVNDVAILKTAPVATPTP